MDGRLFENIVDRVCATLDLQAAITDLQRLLEAHTGIEGIFLGHHAREEKRVYSLAYAGNSRSRELKYAQPAQDALHDYLLSDKRKELNLVNHLNDFPALAATLPPHIPPNHSLYECRVRLDGEHIGMLAFHSVGPPLSDATLGLFMKIRGPVALNLANRLSQLKLWPRRGQALPSPSWAESDHIVCSSPAMRSVYRLLNAAAPTDNTVLLTGETGVGKDVLAHHVHALSPRSQGPFVHVNCGSIPEALIESELFGHQKGAFTGAGANHVGFFEQACGGTIFLDEIGELPLTMQTRLLQVLQNKSIRRLGGTRDIPLDFRVVAATNRDLESMCRDGRFRRDLFFRLDCFRVEIPPLRNRKSDIPVLAENLLKTIALNHGRPGAPSIGAAAMNRLIGYDWPGNIRELKNCLQRSLVLSDGAAFQIDLSPSFACGPSAADTLAPGAVSVDGIGEPPRSMASLEDHIRLHLERALRRSGYRIHGKGGAAELLDINPSTLRSRLKKLGIPFGRQMT